MDRLTSQLMGSMPQGRAPRWMPLDLYRSGDHYVVNIDLPGVDPGSIDLDVDGNTLTIKAERTLQSDGEAQWLAQERPAGSFMRQLALGDGLDVTGIHASYENGVLTLTIPVSERSKPRKIEIQTGQSGAKQVTGPSGANTGESSSQGAQGQSGQGQGSQGQGSQGQGSQGQGSQGQGSQGQGRQG
jgi:HSP20 family protein